MYITYTITIAILIVLSAYFSATETAFSTFSKTRMKTYAEYDNNKKAKLVLKLNDDYDRLLSTILIGNNIVNIAMSSIATLLFLELLGEKWGATVSTAVITVNAFAHFATVADGFRTAFFQVASIISTTGFSTAGATIEDVRLMKKHVGENVLVKAAGGISGLEDAQNFLDEGASRLGTSRVVKAVQGIEGKGY